MHEEYKTITLQWIPFHCSIPGNEKANGMAKKCCFVYQAPYNLSMYESASTMINQMLKITHMSSLKERTKEKPQRSGILKFQDLTNGRDCLFAHFCRFRTVDSLA
ncbi:hypothetical protein NPIL_527951 [Nephila pilipes]|uniref:RNase H type-1 domain-containing protein n=1 Tax=Nephila pilipes TaxID=299642 RepID=A0A8X6Q148_NEPPI|nr:hypothetical protein NPIL_132421 [Nephila pilipes]GFU00546.1 hypothetical protein NPIL_527951 [Nephila pilipes]